MSDIATLEDALAMISAIGSLTGKSAAAGTLLEKIETAFLQIPNHQSAPARHQAPKTAYLIWQNPCMVAAGGTFIHDMLGRMGLQNLFSQKKRYPETTLEELAALQPQVILLSSEPFPFKEKHIEEFRRHCPAAVIKLVDGEMFSWYGSRLLLAAPYFAKLRLEIGHTLEKIC
jgi:ABC-type Fe3+-hydroxamate transport system substrate-binding protein